MTPRRLQRSRRKGARLPEGAVCVTRGTRWGNPYRAGLFSYTPAQAVDRFEAALVVGKLDFKVEDVRRELAGKDLACWCALPDYEGTSYAIDICHAVVLLRIANGKRPMRFPLTRHNSTVLGQDVRGESWGHWWSTAQWQSAQPTQGGKAPLNVPCGPDWDGALYTVRPRRDGPCRPVNVNGQWYWHYEERWS